MLVDGFCFTERNFEPKNYLRGYVFTDNALVFGSKGMNEFNTQTGLNLWSGCKYGRFLLMETEGSITFIRTDPSGQEPLYYFQHDERWCISNSLLLIAEELKAQGYPLTPYLPAIHAFKMSNQSLNGGQLTSFNTPISGVKLLPLHFAFRIEKDVSQTKYQLQLFKLQPEAEQNDYQVCLYNYCNNWLGRVNAISQSSKTTILSLSGGFDSRACLSIMQNTKTSEKLLLRVDSHKHVPDEYEIAEALCQRIGIAVGKSNKPKTNAKKPVRKIAFSAESSYRNSMLIHAGVKTNFGFREVIKQDKTWHCLGGSVIGTHSMRLSFEQKKCDLIAKYGQTGEIISNEIGAALTHMGIEHQNELAMFHHYYQFRARFHYGMDLYTSQHAAQLHPLLDTDLVQASVLAGRDYTKGNGINRDIISLMCPQLLDVPFDGNRQPISNSLIQALSSTDLAPVSYTNYGTFEDSYDHDVRLQSVVLTESEGVSSPRDVLRQNIDGIKNIALMCQFSDRYVSEAINELAKGLPLKKAGVLFGLLELFK